MRQTLLCVVVVLLATCAGRGAPPPVAPPVVAPPAGVPGVIPELRGQWVIVDAEISGKKSKSKYVWEFHDGKIMRKLPTSKITTTWSFYADPTKNPKEIDLITSTSPVAKPSPGIYQVDGDTLRICYASATKTGINKMRPTAFTTMPGDGHVLYTFKRQN